MTITFIDPYRLASPATGGYLPETEAWIAGCTTPPSDTRKDQMNTLIGALKTAAVWSKLSLLYVLAAHAELDALINVVDPGNFDLTRVNSPNFTVDEGFDSAGGSGYLDTGWDPATDGAGLYTRDDAHLGVAEISGDGTLYRFGSATSTYSRVRGLRSNGTIAGSINTSSGLLASGYASSTLAVVSVRRSSTTQLLFEAGAQVATHDDASSALTTADFNILRTNTTQIPSGVTVGVAHCGAALSDSEAAALHAANSTYLTAIGAWS